MRYRDIWESRGSLAKDDVLAAITMNGLTPSILADLYRHELIQFFRLEEEKS